MRVKQAGISSVFLWRRPPTGNATLCNIGASVFQGDALCPSRTSCESISSSACAWQQPVCNWWATFIALLCSGISFGWRGYGPRKRNGARARRPRQTKDFTQRTRSLCDSRPAQLSNARCDVRTRDNSMSLLPHGLPAIPSPICIALNCSRGRRQEGVEPLLYDGVALAGCFFEAATIENLNVPPMIADKAGLL
jgi:hypothetical protein